MPDNAESDLANDVTVGIAARQIAENPAFQDAVSRIKEQLENKLYNLGVSEDLARYRVSVAMHIVTLLADAFPAAVERGEFSGKQIKKIQDRGLSWKS